MRRRWFFLFIFMGILSWFGHDGTRKKQPRAILRKAPPRNSWDYYECVGVEWK